MHGADPCDSLPVCGRYAASRSPDDLVEEVVAAGLPVQPARPDDVAPLRPSYNVAPTTPVATLVPARRDEGGGSDAAARLRAMRWGLVPSWAKDVKIGNRMINARVETVLEKPAFRSLVGGRRCLLPADGWYEWQVVPGERTGGAARKQPFFMSAPQQPLLAIAGLHTWWRDPAVQDDDDPAAWVGSVTVLTTEAEPGLQAVHDRMPLVLQPGLWAQWLSPDVPAQEALDMAVGQAAGRFTARPVGTGVGNVRNDSPGLLDPVPLGALQGVVDPATGELYA